MIKLVQTTEELFDERQKYTQSKIGLVPTMGNLHEGHLSLVRASLLENDVTIVTIYVNPKQFGPDEDYDSYPRTLDQDLARLETIEDEQTKILVFSPKDHQQIYPEGFSTNIQVLGITDKLCGHKRPGHFDGVATVVYQLFTLTDAHQAYFGQKDYQQFKVIERMSKDLKLPIVLKMGKIVRDKNGLALSSRNQYMTSDNYEKALTLPRTLKAIAYLLETQPLEKSLPKAQLHIKNALQEDENWEYLELLDSHQLHPITEETRDFALLGAYQVGKTRLIDNQLVRAHAGK